MAKHGNPKVFTKQQVRNLIAKYWQDEVYDAKTSVGYSQWLKDNNLY